MIAHAQGSQWSRCIARFAGTGQGVGRLIGLVSALSVCLRPTGVAESFHWPAFLVRTGCARQITGFFSGVFISSKSGLEFFSIRSRSPAHRRVGRLFRTPSV